jgi:hypothetical protein
MEAVLGLACTAGRRGKPVLKAPTLAPNSKEHTRLYHLSSTHVVQVVVDLSKHTSVQLFPEIERESSKPA